jgi:hypothetical protein
LAAAIVFMLAVLQYHWTGQVSEAAEERMRETLNASTSQFRQEFSRELLRICSGLQLDPAAPPPAQPVYRQQAPREAARMGPFTWRL